MVAKVSARWLPVVLALLVFPGADAWAVSPEDDACVDSLRASHASLHDTAKSFATNFLVAGCTAATVPLSDWQIPTCMDVCLQAMREMDDQRDISIARALAVYLRLSGPLRSCPASIPRSSLLISSLLEFA